MLVFCNKTGGLFYDKSDNLCDKFSKLQQKCLELPTKLVTYNKSGNATEVTLVLTGVKGGIPEFTSTLMSTVNVI